MIDIAKQHQKYDEKGNPFYTITSGLIHTVIPAENLKKK